jgi:erythronate-4-phosphate dehydrogenase
MIIAVDEDLPYRDEALSQLGSLRPYPGRSLKTEDLRDVDALVVRTITPVNGSLLKGTPVRWVAAASAGTDHVDQSFLKSHGIHFSYAAGSNANAVSEYILTALYVVASRKSWDLSRKSLAVIGVGNVGSRVARKAQALGMNVLLCDPPLRDLTGDSRYRPLEDVLGADILTFHVPLTSQGPYPTVHMLGRDLLGRLKPGQFILNSSRGKAVDGLELKKALESQRISGAVLDVWEREPNIDYSLLNLLEIGTPHIAGTSLDAKIRATEMIREELSRFLGVSSSPLPDSTYPVAGILSPGEGTSGQEAVLSVLLQAFHILKKDEKLRALGSLPAEKAARDFDRLRVEPPLRLEFSHFVVGLCPVHADLEPAFKALGFKVKKEQSQP